MCSTAIRTSSARQGDAYRLRNDALALECASYLKQQLGSCNIEDMLQSAYGQTRIEMTREGEGVVPEISGR